jgi:hypothetical protein
MARRDNSCYFRMIRLFDNSTPEGALAACLPALTHAVEQYNCCNRCNRCNRCPAGGLEYCVQHPYISYPAVATFTLAALPGEANYLL